MNLFLDLESRSELDLKICGLDRYAKHPSTRVLMMAWAVDSGDVELWQPHLGDMPEILTDHIQNPNVIKVAWNSAFERTMLRCVRGIDLDYARWLDPMVNARYLSLPGSLEAVGEIIEVDSTQQKMHVRSEYVALSGEKIQYGAEDQNRLIMQFCMPAQLAGDSDLFGKSDAKFRDWTTDPEDWKLFGEYCKRDVESERANLKKMSRFALPASEMKLWYLDQKINDVGIPADMILTNNAITIAEQAKSDLLKEIKEITNAANPNSRDQILDWAKRNGYPYGSLGKNFVKKYLDDPKKSDNLCKEVLRLRQQAAKTSDSKFQAIRDVVSEDGRLRHQFSFMGAARTGRWAGKDFQMQNLPRPDKEVEKKVELAVNLIRAGDYSGLKKNFRSVVDAIVGSVRAAIRAPEWDKLVVCDLNAIENRVLGWVARCDRVLKVFRDKKDPYLDFAVYMYKKSYEELELEYKSGADKHKRQVAKSAVLGCGYRLSGGEEATNSDGDDIKTGLWGYSENMGVKMTREEAHNAVKIYRETYPEVKQLWYDLENAVESVMQSGQPENVGRVRYERTKNVLRCVLPSGRALHYVHPRMETREFDGYNGPVERTNLTYDGVDQKTKKWGRQSTHGGKLTENIVQAIARDVLANGMLLADAAGMGLVGHCHDELISVESFGSQNGLPELKSFMETRPEWAPDLPLGAEGYEDVFYHKD